MRIEVFYTGGGVTLAEAVIDRERYAVVSSEAPECLSVYTRTEGSEPYMPEDMVLSAVRDELPPELQELHGRMLAALNS